MPPEATPLRVAIDARDLLRAQRTGVERMLHEFIAHLAPPEPEGAGERAGNIDPPGPGSPPAARPDCLLLFDRHHPLVERLARQHRVAVLPVRHPRLQRLFDAWCAFQVGPLLRAAGIEVFYSPNTKLPLTGTVPAVTTVHGVEWRFHPQGYHWVERLKQRFWFEACTRRAAGLVTFAAHTRADIGRLRRAHGRPVRVVGEGVARMFRTLPATERDAGVPRRLGIGAPYILSVASLVPRKNIPNLLRATALLAAHGRPHQLVLVGKPGWRAGQLHTLADQLGLGARVVFTGFVDDATLVQLYNQAALFAYPSFYEGFGLPILEAYACGTPVVTARASATAEVAGAGALLVDPADPAGLARAMARLLDDAGLRARLRQHAAARLAEFQWPRMTAAICAFLADVARGLPEHAQRQPADRQGH